MSRTRVAEGMGPMMPNGWLERTQPFADCFPKTRAAQGTIWSMQREKHMTGRTVQPHLFQVTQDRRADRWCQRIFLSPPRFWSDNSDYLTVPVQVFQLQTLDLFRSKSVHNKQQQNGPVTDVYTTVARRTCQQLLNDFPRGSGRKQLMLIDICAPGKRPCAPEDGLLTPGIGYCITPFPSFLDRPGIENRVYFSYAWCLIGVDGIVIR